jgi:multidrug efflux system membrane fusion protein
MHDIIKPEPKPKPPVEPPELRELPAKGTIPIMVWVLLAAVALVVVYAFVLKPKQSTVSTGGGGGRARMAPPPPQVTTTNAHKGDIGVYVNALGAVTPVYTVNVKSRVDGQLMSVNYVEGQRVKEGDSLVEIDPRPFQAQLTQAEGQLARDKALLENAHVDLDRYQTAYSKNAIPKQQLDTQVATVHQYEGTVKFDQGQVDNARLQLNYSHITAPITGRVGLRLVDPGNIVHATDSNPLAIITQLEPITVVFSIAEDYLPEIQKQLNQGKKLVVEAYDRAQQKKLATGTLLTVDNQIDPSTGTIKLKALFPNEDDALFPNQFVNARLLVDTQQDATLLPTAVIQRSAQGPFVYVLQPDQTVAMKNITVGNTEGNMSAVEGLDLDQRVVADNFNRLQDGMKVVTGEHKHGSGSKSALGTNSARGGSSAP